MRILVTDGMDKKAIAALKELGNEVVEQFYEPDQLGAALKDFDAVVVRSKTKVRKNHIDDASEGRLKLIIRGGIGVDNIDVAYAIEKGIQVRNTPLASARSVAELALAHIFSSARYISHAGYTMRSGAWEKKTYGKGLEISGKTLGIIGYGSIGSCLGQLASSLGMTVLPYGANHEPGTPAKDGTIYVSMDELLQRSDFISLHAPAAKKPIIDAEAIAKMKDGVVIINTSRGANVDEDALLEALNSGKVRAAGLDVWAEEPTKNLALCSHPHVSCTPHIGAATVEAQARIGQEIVEIIKNYQE